MKRKVDVTLLGQRLSVRTERDDAWVHGLATLVNRRFEELRRQARTASAQELAALLALTLAEELHEQRERSDRVEQELARVATSTLARVEHALAALGDASDDRADDSDLVAAPVDDDAPVSADA